MFKNFWKAWREHANRSALIFIPVVGISIQVVEALIAFILFRIAIMVIL